MFKNWAHFSIIVSWSRFEDLVDQKYTDLSGHLFILQVMLFNLVELVGLCVFGPTDF